MTYKVLKPFTVQVRGELIKLKEGQSISIPEEKAIKLITEGKIKSIESKQTTSRIQGEVFFELVNGKRITLSDILKWPEFNRG